jgi:hypothetical protein
MSDRRSIVAGPRASSEVARYVGTGKGEWHGDWFVYVPSVDDLALASDLARRVAERVTKVPPGDRSGEGPSGKTKAEWERRGILGEVAALYPVGSGPDLEAWEGRGDWRGRADYGQVEVRTTSHWQLYGFARAGKNGVGYAGWIITAKDRGRVVVCVQDRGHDFSVMGWCRADSIPRLPVPLGGILAVIDPLDLRPLPILYQRMKEIG